MRIEEPGVQSPDGVLPGRLTRRLIGDWFLGDLNDDPHHERLPDYQVSEWSCPRLRDPYLRKSNASMEHDLIVIPTQSYDETSNSPDGQGTALFSCICRFCRYHFVFKISSGICGTRQDYPQHHFVPQSFNKFAPQDVEANLEARLYPVLCHALYQCSACPKTVELEVSAPRLKAEWVSLITDQQRIRDSLRASREEDPDRYRDVNEETELRYATGSLSTLNQYLKDVLELSPGSRRRISARNKTFMVQFGASCAHIFRYLGFDVDHDEETGDNYWLPPHLEAQEGKTPLYSPRAFYEDVRNEVQSLLEENPPLVGPPVVKLVSPLARESLAGALQVAHTQSHGGKTVFVQDAEAADFRLLGAPTDSDDDILKWAYQRQIQTDPRRKQVYLGALGRLAARRDVDLQLFCFAQQDDPQQTTQNASSASKDPVDKAYAHFNLSRTRAEPASFFINVYRTFRDQSPAQKAQHRVALLQIGRDRNSNEILSEVYMTDMEHPEACSYLGVEPGWPMENIAAFAQSSVSDLDLDLTIKALEAISIAVNDDSRPGFEAIFADIRSQRPTQGTSATGNAGDNNEQDDSATVDMDKPAGLGNLRNTCYLNSILQYFYSVNAVRDLALSSEQPELTPSEQALRDLLKDKAPDLEPGRAFVGSEFSRELRALFQALDISEEVSVTPRQRLANAALLRPEKIRPKTEGAVAPPLPPRNGESSEPKVTVDVAEHSETASVVSSQTLVDKPDEDPSYVVVTHDAVAKASSSAMEIDDPDAASVAASQTKDSETKSSKLTVEELAVELDKPNVGSDQMDVDEVMGNAIDHLRAAYKIAHVNHPDAGPDPIEQAFFSTFIDNRKKADETSWNRASRSDRWVTAYPAKSGRRDLYEALTASFDLERLHGDLLSFTTIEKPAPNFHICIQRSDGVSKNSNPIKIPETLYLDRFMHTVDEGSELFQSKKRAWDIKNRINETEPAAKEPTKESGKTAKNAGVVAKGTADEVPDIDEIDGFLLIECSNGLQSSEGWDSWVETAQNKPKNKWRVFDSAIKESFTTHLGRKPDIATAPADEEELPGVDAADETAVTKSEAAMQGFWTAFDAAQEDERLHLKAEKEAMFEKMTDVPYRLHAVVCHAGATASAGHYWVWIHDFEQDVWRKYNDTRVSVHPADFVFEELNTKGEPYYLAYARASEIGHLVSVPRRKAQNRDQGQEDVEMMDIPLRPNAADAEQVEDATMEPPPYSIM